MRKYFVCISIIFAVITLSAVSAFSQDSQVAPKDETVSAQAPAVQTPQAEPAASSPAAPVETEVKTNELSIYGEVQAVNAQAASISVQYYDYDNDEEKTIEVSLDKDSKLENVKAVDEVKKGDWVDVTYVAAGGKNVAKMVSVEAEEVSAEENAPVETTEE
jgi:hypothetical protein